MSAFFSRVVNSVKSDLGIRSPSKVFADIGKNMAEGLGLGFDGQMDKVARTMQNAIPANLSSNAEFGMRNAELQGMRQTEAMVDAISTLSAGGASGDLHLHFIVNGREMAVGLLPDFRRAMAASPITVSF